MGTVFDERDHRGVEVEAAAIEVDGLPPLVA
jgi:hypothetical protein